MSAGSKDKIKISFLGQNAHEVTGSMIWVKTPHVEFLIECGLYQGVGEALDEYKINNAPFKFKPQDISYVFACHCHTDHIGRLPLLYKRQSNALTIMPQGSLPIAKILLEDSAKIMESDCYSLSRRYSRCYSPIYQQRDVDLCLSRMREYPMGEYITLDDYVKFRFVPSGHILNAAQIEIAVTEGNITKTIGYTSDLGNVHIKKEYANEFEPLGRCNILIGEATYGGETRIATQKVREKDLEKLKSTIEDTCLVQRGRVLIPCFANSRSQEILSHLFDLFGDDPNFKIPILFDTPMGINICKAYTELLTGDALKKWQRVLEWQNIKFISDPDESKAWQTDKSPAVILSSSGMMTYGRSRAYAKEMIEGANNVIIFCGFSVDNSLAAVIKTGQSSHIRFNGKWMVNRCRVVDMRSFSSHMQRDSLLDYYSSVDCEKVLLVHGDMAGKVEFAKELQKQIHKHDRTSKAVCVFKGYTLTL